MIDTRGCENLPSLVSNDAGQVAVTQLHLESNPVPACQVWCQTRCARHFQNYLHDNFNESNCCTAHSGAREGRPLTLASCSTFREVRWAIFARRRFFNHWHYIYVDFGTAAKTLVSHDPSSFCSCVSCFENRLIFGEVMGKSIVSCFLTHSDW